MVNNSGANDTGQEYLIVANMVNMGKWWLRMVNDGEQYTVVNTVVVGWEWLIRATNGW